MQYAYGFGPLMIVQLTGSAALAGLSVALIALSRFAIAYPIGKITDTYGRKLGVIMGLLLAIFGALVLGFSVGLKSPVMFIGGLLSLSDRRYRVGAPKRHVAPQTAVPAE